MRALTKRPVTVSELEAVADSIEVEVRRGGGEADAEAIGDLALRALVKLDRVAAIRFASVYRNFEGLDEFEAELRRVETEPMGSDRLLTGPVMEGADIPQVPSDARGRIRRSPAAPAAGPPEPGTTKRRVHAE